MERIYFNLLLGVVSLCCALSIISCAAPPYIYITNFEIVPSPIYEGESASIIWYVNGSTKVEIDNGIGEVAPYGNMEIKPIQTAKYTLTAYNSGRSLQKSIVVDVVSRPTPKPAEIPQVKTILATDSDMARRYVGQEVRVEGNITYIAAWLPSRFSGSGGDFRPWTFIFFMKDVFDGANYPGSGPGGESGGPMGPGESNNWLENTGYFRAIIKPDYADNFHPYLPVGCYEYLRTPQAHTKLLPFGLELQENFPVVLRGKMESYQSGTAIYLTDKDQISVIQR